MGKIGGGRQKRFVALSVFDRLGRFAKNLRCSRLAFVKDCKKLKLPDTRDTLRSRFSSTAIALVKAGRKRRWADTRDTLRFLIFRPPRAVHEKSALLETRPSQKPVAAFGRAQRTFLLCKKVRSFGLRHKKTASCKQGPFSYGGGKGIRTLVPFGQTVFKTASL